jgi:hypothetical protein
MLIKSYGGTIRIMECDRTILILRKRDIVAAIVRTEAIPFLAVIVVYT